MYSLLYFISHPIDVSNATISGLIDCIKNKVSFRHFGTFRPNFKGQEVQGELNKEFNFLFLSLLNLWTLCRVAFTFELYYA
jgi:hypothetical protein